MSSFSCHANCAEYSPDIGVFEGKWSGVFDTVDRSRYSECTACQVFGASVLCSAPSCSNCYHLPCAIKLGWDYEENGNKFFCVKHNVALSSVSEVLDSKAPEKGVDSQIIHGMHNKNTEGNIVAIDSSDDELERQASPDCSSAKKDLITFSIAIPLTFNDKSYKSSGGRSIVRLGRIARDSIRERWNVEFYATCIDNSHDRILTIASTIPDPFDQFEEGDVVKSINGMRIGSANLDTLQKFYLFINQQVEVLLEVRRVLGSSSCWN